MNLVLNILLVFCIGVSYSSAGSSGSDVARTGKSPAEDIQVPVNHTKVQTIITTNASQPVTSKIPTNANSSVKVEPVIEETKAKLPVVINNKNTSTDARNTSTPIVIPKMQNTTSTNITALPVPTQTINSTNTTQKSTNITTVATPMSTAAPVVSIADHAASTPTAQERQFDGPSFVGGIVLTVGLTVIGFIAFKFYKSGKIERNYRTL